MLVLVTTDRNTAGALEYVLAALFHLERNSDNKQDEDDGARTNKETYVYYLTNANIEDSSSLKNGASSRDELDRGATGLEPGISKIPLGKVNSEPSIAPPPVPLYHTGSFPGYPNSYPW